MKCYICDKNVAVGKLHFGCFDYYVCPECLRGLKK